MAEILTKTQFYTFARQARVVEERHLSFGSAGFDGGVDGSMSAAAFYNVVRTVTRNFMTDDPLAYGFDIGHGTGFAAVAYFNYGLNLNMVGIESNPFRTFCSWIFQKAMLSHKSREDFRGIAKKSQLYHGVGVEGLTAIFGSTESIVHLKLIYWFREGWNPDDITLMVDYINRMMINLEWIICDMSSVKLLDFGFIGEIVSTSQFTGRLNKSSNTRSLFVHRLIVNRRPEVICGEKEHRVLKRFDPDFDSLSHVNHSLALYLSSDEVKRQQRGSRAVRTNQVFQHIVGCKSQDQDQEEEEEISMSHLEKFMQAVALYNSQDGDGKKLSAKLKKERKILRYEFFRAEVDSYSQSIKKKSRYF